MRIIKKIEIKNFRSFLGTTKNDRAKILDMVDLNILSGSNDSGKSNVLRALNLFFNDEIDNIHFFDFTKDFNVFRTGTQKVIEIKIHFKVNKRTFSISKFWNRNGYRNSEYRFTKNHEEIIIDSRPEHNQKRYKNKKNILDKEKGYRRYASAFVSSVSYSYVPAIREERFFSHLYGKIIFKIKKNEEKEIEILNTEKRKIKNYKKTLKNKSENKEFIKNIKDPDWRKNRIDEINKTIEETGKIGKSIESLQDEVNIFSKDLFKSASFLSSKFKIVDNLLDFFETFEIGTGDKDISLKLRGDGMQAKFIPEMLNFIDSISGEKYFIWGFEEPENSAEYKNQQDLSKKIIKFSKDKQIFLTTHSEEFLSLHEEENVKLFHVIKSKSKKYSDFSIIKNIFEINELTDDLGESFLRAKYSFEMKKKDEVFIEEKKKLEDKIKKLKKTDKPILFVEGQLEEKLFNKILVDDIDFQIINSGSSDELSNYIIGKSFSEKQYKVLGLLDKDQAGKDAVQKIKEKRHKNPFVENKYIEPNTDLKKILETLTIDFSLDELMPDFVWKYLDNNNFLEDGNKFKRSLIPNNQSFTEFVTTKFSNKIHQLKVSKKIKREKKRDFETYLLRLNDSDLAQVKVSLCPVLDNVKKFFGNMGKKM